MSAVRQSDSTTQICLQAWVISSRCETILKSYVRKYPFNTLACDAIGFASNVNGGELGLESQYDDEFSGTDGVSYSYVDEDLNAVETTSHLTETVA